MTEAQTVDLDVLTGGGAVHNLSGHERGLHARLQFQLDNFDEAKNKVVIKVPDHIYGLSPSFVQGLLSASVLALGSRDAFFSFYSIMGSELIQRQFDRGLDAILTDRNLSG